MAGSMARGTACEHGNDAAGGVGTEASFTSAVSVYPVNAGYFVAERRKRRAKEEQRQADRPMPLEEFQTWPFGVEADMSSILQRKLWRISAAPPALCQKGTSR